MLLDDYKGKADVSTQEREKIEEIKFSKPLLEFGISVLEVSLKILNQQYKSKKRQLYEVTHNIERLMAEKNRCLDLYF